MRLANLPRAAQHGDVAELSLLLNAGAHPNEPVLLPSDHLVTPLMLAAASSSDAVRILLHHGADPNATSNRNESALWFALPNVDTLRVLLESAINQANLQSALCRPACLKNAESVRMLLQHGASPNAPQFEDPFRIPLFKLRGVEIGRA